MDREAALELLMDRFECPRFKGVPALAPAATETLVNPRCGDVVTVYLTVGQDGSLSVAFDGRGCTVSQAAADLTAELAQGLAPSEILALPADAVLDLTGREAVQTRLDCATLAMRALQRAAARLSL